MQSMAAFWDNVWFLTREPETEAKRFKTDRTFVVVVHGTVICYDWERRHVQ